VEENTDNSLNPCIGVLAA